MRYGFLSILLILCAGCAVGPTYRPPELRLPACYMGQLCCDQRYGLSNWWRSFQDEQLEGLIARAISCNYDLRIALEKIVESRNIHHIETAKLLPQINFFSAVLGADLGNGLLSDALGVRGRVSSWVAAADTLWEIDVWGRLRHNKAAALYQCQSQAEDAADVKVMLIAEIARTYIHMCSAHMQVRLLEKIRTARERLVGLYTHQMTSGLLEKQQELDERVKLNQASINVDNQRIELTQSRNKLAFLLGAYPDQLELNILDLKDVPIPTSEPRIEGPYELLRRRPDIRKAERLLAASYEQIGAAMAEWFPRVSILGLLGGSSVSACGIDSGKGVISAVGPLFNMPILDFGRIYFNVKVQESGQRQALLTFEKSVANALQDVENWIYAYNTDKLTILQVAAQYAQEKERYRLTKDLFKSGLASGILLLDQYVTYLEIARSLTQTRERISADFIALYKALGGGW